MFSLYISIKFIWSNGSFKTRASLLIICLDDLPIDVSGYYFKLIISYVQIYSAAAAAAKLPQSCSTLCGPRDGSPPGSPVPGILQARILEWVAISFSNAWKWKVKVKLLSRVWLFVTPWTAAYQAPLSMGFSMQEYWSGVPLLSLLFILGCIININDGKM